MFFTCSPACADPTHHHTAADRLSRTSVATSQAATKTPTKSRAQVAPKPSTQKTVRNSKGKLKVVDVHCHYLNPVVNQKTAHLNAAQYDPTVIFANDLTNQTNAKQMKDRAPKLMGIDVRLKDMDRMGVDIQAVAPAPYHYFYFTEPAYGAELAREVNEGIANVVAQHPDRFVGMGSVPLQNAELAVKELEYCVKKLGLRGVEINTNVNGLNLTDPTLGLEKFFAKANELGIVVFMHPLGYTQGERLRNHYFNNVIGNPLETTVAVSHLIFDGVVARYPKIKFLAAHGGGFLAHYWARMDHAWRARPDTRTVIKKKPSSYLEKFYFDSITFDPRMLKQLIDRYGADHVMLGTDYPYDMGEDDPRGLIAGVNRLSAADRRLIEGGNAMKLFKIK
ncbi:amidohydrolase family protein [Limnohabitans sp.]|jgi:aminocarboxymuconate-semialdehyde decarboxylase|uniref:amidohydrolase family protein n=1 Tax=Limnohabitans sp. TaxID=1907725 RepID=UPI00333ED079